VKESTPFTGQANTAETFHPSNERPVRISSSTFLITGGSSGLGAACVERLAAAGANVVIADVNLTSTGQDKVLACRVDVTNSEEVAAAIQQTTDKFGALHGVVNCAGILGAARVLGRDGPHDLALFRRVIEINLIGSFNVVRLAAQAMSANRENADGERGVIVNTSSVAAFEGQIGQAAYSASKGGIASMTLPLARDLARHGIRVVAIAPGVFQTPMMDVAPEKVQQSLQAQTVFPQRLGQPGEFAALVQHILENRMLNGSVIRLDGAMRMGPV
jgi:NAD(P)-dependent dehydrogenase (short-subunit alcohol dehydrogenase family)